MRRQFQQQTLAALARHHRGAVGPALQDRLRRLQDQIVFGPGPVVAGQAAPPQDGPDFFLEIDAAGVFYFGDVNRGLRGDGDPDTRTIASRQPTAIRCERGCGMGIARVWR